MPEKTHGHLSFQRPAVLLDAIFGGEESKRFIERETAQIQGIFALLWYSGPTIPVRQVMAYQIFPLTHNRLEVRCATGDIVHVAYDALNDWWSVEEDREHRTFQNRGDAIDRARLIGRDPDYGAN